MTHIRITRPDKLTGEKQVLNVNKAGADGEIKLYCCFVNNLTPIENMTTLCMSEHGINNWWDEKLRARYAKEIKIGFRGRLPMFFIDDNVYVAAPVMDKKGKVIWDADKFKTYDYDKENKMERSQSYKPERGLDR